MRIIIFRFQVFTGSRTRAVDTLWCLPESLETIKRWVVWGRGSRCLQPGNLQMDPIKMTCLEGTFPKWWCYVSLTLHISCQGSRPYWSNSVFHLWLDSFQNLKSHKILWNQQIESRFFTLTLWFPKWRSPTSPEKVAYGFKRGHFEEPGSECIKIHMYIRIYIYMHMVGCQNVGSWIGS